MKKLILFALISFVGIFAFSQTNEKLEGYTDSVETTQAINKVNEIYSPTVYEDQVFFLKDEYGYAHPGVDKVYIELKLSTGGSAKGDEGILSIYCSKLARITEGDFMNTAIGAIQDFCVEHGYKHYQYIKKDRRERNTVIPANGIENKANLPDGTKIKIYQSFLLFTN